MKEKEKDYIIEKSTQLLIQTDFYEREKGVEVYIRKKQAYHDLIKLVKEAL